MATILRKITAHEFARRLNMTSEQSDKRFAFFLGAGCSVSSGIPAAAKLVKDVWLPRLRDLRAPNRKDLDEWATKEIPGYAPESAASSYGTVMDELFLEAEERQREIEDLCDRRFPGFGYASLASLITMDGGCFNVVLTTNFDDLVADALYLFTTARPLVIHHESLASFIRPTRTRPLVVKLHGDQRLSPQNTAMETATLKKDIEKQVRTILHDRGLIFVGYGGNDQGIRNTLEALPAEALPLGVFWVSGEEPSGAIRPWLEARNAVWVEKGDFDELMLLVRDAFELPHPERKRFDDVFDKYRDTYETMSKSAVAKPESDPDAAALKKAVRRTDKSFPDWWSVELAARRVKYSDLDRAEAIYEEGIKQFPKSAELLGNYASFLMIYLKDNDRAEKYYQRAFEVNPKGTHRQGNYAGFLLTRKREEEGLPLLEEAMQSARSEGKTDLEAECWFYALAHWPPERRAEAMKNLKRVLQEGARSPYWNLSPHIEVAREQGHPALGWLEKLAAVITEDADIKILDDWPAWKEADAAKST